MRISDESQIKLIGQLQKAAGEIVFVPHYILIGILKNMQSGSSVVSIARFLRGHRWSNTFENKLHATSKSSCCNIVMPCRRREVLFDVDVQQCTFSATGLDITRLDIETNMRLRQAQIFIPRYIVNVAIYFFPRCIAKTWPIIFHIFDHKAGKLNCVLFQSIFHLVLSFL